MIIILKNFIILLFLFTLVQNIHRKASFLLSRVELSWVVVSNRRRCEKKNLKKKEYN